MIIYVDIDDTICTYDGERNYPDAIPIQDRIQKINDLYDAGHHIVYWTARGGTTGLDWTEVTNRQIKEWGAKCHEVRMHKPPYDLFICDKAINTLEYFKENKNETI